MTEFNDGRGTSWIADTIEEDTPRHHGRWYLVFHPAGQDSPPLPTPEVRWQTRAEADRTLATMSLFELRRRLAGTERRAGAATMTAPWIDRTINAG